MRRSWWRLAYGKVHWQAAHHGASRHRRFPPHLPAVEPSLHNVRQPVAHKIAPVEIAPAQPGYVCRLVDRNVERVPITAGIGERRIVIPPNLPDSSRLLAPGLGSARSVTGGNFLLSIELSLSQPCEKKSSSRDWQARRLHRTEALTGSWRKLAFRFLRR